MNSRDRIEGQKALITDRLHLDFGLLDELLASQSLTRSEVADVKALAHSYGRSEKLLEYVSDKGIYEQFLEALKNTQQTHLVNFISSNGEHLAEFGDDWPLTDREISILDTNQRSLVDLLDTTDLIQHLYSCKVISSRQKDFVSSKTASHEKNEALLELLRRTSLQDYKKTIHCLHLSKQNRVAKIFEDSEGIIGDKDELEKSCYEDNGSVSSNSAVRPNGRPRITDAEENIEKQLTEIKQCPVCMNEFTDPRMLPCNHTFCFKCLKRTGETNQKKPGDHMQCPVCSKEFTIPSDGMSGLQKNFFMENILKFDLSLQARGPAVSCDMSDVNYEKSRTEETPTAKLRCPKCHKNYCDSCANAHHLQETNNDDQEAGPCVRFFECRCKALQQGQSAVRQSYKNSHVTKIFCSIG